MRTRKRKLHFRFYIFITLFLCAAVYLLVTVLNRGEGELSLGSLRFDLRADMILIRDETVISAEKFDCVSFYVEEGSTVEPGDSIAQVYKLGYSDELMQALLNIQKDIHAEQMLQFEDIEDAELTDLNAQITSKQAQLRNAQLNDTGENILRIEQELKALLQARAEYLKGKVQVTDKLSQLYAQENDQTALIDSWRTNAVAPSAGVVSFYFDGYEKALNVAKLDMLNADLLKSVLKGVSITDSVNATEKQLYRLINTKNWYAAFITPSSDPVRLVKGVSYTVVFDGHYDKPYTAVALEPVLSQDNVINLLQFSDDIGSLLSVRNIEASIKTDVQGIEVDRKALVMSDGLAGITIVSGNTENRVEVEVLAANDEYAIIRPRNQSDELTVGLRYLTR